MFGWPDLRTLSVTSSPLTPPYYQQALQPAINRHRTSDRHKAPAQLPPLLKSLTLSLHSQVALHLLHIALTSPSPSLHHLAVSSITSPAPFPATRGPLSSSAPRLALPATLRSVALVLDRWSEVALPLPAASAGLRRVAVSREMVGGMTRGDMGVWLGGLPGLEELRLVRADGFTRNGFEVGGVSVHRRAGAV